MGRGYSAFTSKRHSKVRKLYKERVAELGDMAKYTSKEYFVEYISQKLKEDQEDYSDIRIRQILNMKQQEILQREIED